MSQAEIEAKIKEVGDEIRELKKSNADKDMIMAKVSFVSLILRHRSQLPPASFLLQYSLNPSLLCAAAPAAKPVYRRRSAS